MKIRNANPSDIPSLFYLIKKTAEFDTNLADLNGIISTSEEKIKNTMFNHQLFAWAFLVVNETNLPIGIALYHIRYSSFKGLPYIWLDDLYILMNIENLD